MTPFLPYGEKHRKQRAFQHRFLSSPDMVNYLEIQSYEIRITLQGILANPKDYAKHVRRYVHYYYSIARHSLIIGSVCLVPSS